MNLLERFRAGLEKVSKPSLNMLMGKRQFPPPPKVPSMLNTALGHGLGDFSRHMPVAATPATMNAATVVPGKVALAADMTAAQRSEIPKKDFALTGKQSTTKKPAYPIHDEKHARLALAFVKMHGSPGQQGEVYKDVARKYPHLAQASSISELKAHVKSASAADSMGKAIGKGNAIGRHLMKHHDAYDVGGLGILGAFPAYEAAQEASKASKGKKVDKSNVARSGLELAGLGTLAAPTIANMLSRGGH